jgi:tetraacyldisaccharide 4'-kinase
VNAQYYILLTAYDDLFSDDYILPFGNLRESAIGKKRANLVIVTKCPATLSEQKQEQVKQKLKVKVPVFFTSIDYDTEVFGTENTMNVSEVITKEKVIVAGIAKPKYFIDYLNSGKDKVMIYPDHHHFSEQEILELNALAQEKNVITTEKDYVRLNGKINSDKLFYLPIRIKLIKEEVFFNDIIRNWVKNYLT